jgi:hypothetical protein
VQSLPFTAEQFFGVFRAYHETFWPAPIVWNGLALACVILVARWRGRADRWIAGFLAALWVWVGTAYHIATFTSINRAAWAFGTLFVLQGIFFAFSGVLGNHLRFGVDRGVRGVVGGVLIGYALVIYPLVGAALGHRYPAAPSFGLPCPSTIFTFGLLLWTTAPVPRHLLVIPVLWALIGSSAVFNWGVLEDAVMPLGAILATIMLLRRSTPGQPARQPAAGIKG